jgi:hypothetical protein
MTRDLGFTQIDHHGGGAGFFRFGDFELNRDKWPDGWDTYRRIVARLHEAGIGSIFHTYAFFMTSEYVAPVPDPPRCLPQFYSRGRLGATEILRSPPQTWHAHGHQQRGSTPIIVTFAGSKEAPGASLG